MQRLTSSQRLLSTLRDSFRQIPVVEPRPRHILVAFSGGTDSTCLLWGLLQLATELDIEVTAAHLDHRLDPGSSERAEAARLLAKRIGANFHSTHADTSSFHGQSLEGYARQVRYRYLEQLADRLDADWIATAHHRDDQAETVLLRLLFGTGIEGLAAIQPLIGRRFRPMLGLRRQHLEEAASEIGLRPIHDPTNRDLRRPRNKLRHQLLPRWLASEPRLVDQLGNLAETTRRARQRIDHMLKDRLTPRALPLGERIGFDRLALQALPEQLLPFALALLARENQVPYPIPTEARREIERQLRTQDAVGCDCGHGWRLEADRRQIWMRPREPSVGEFAYTLAVPGTVAIPELGLGIRVERKDVAPWMFLGRPNSSAISGQLLEGSHVTIRNRRPGDRIRPLGSTRSRRLKDLLIDRHVPRPWRDRLPLLEVGGNIAWVPGVTIGDDFRLRQDPTVWVLSIERQSSLTQESVAIRTRSDDGSKERSNP